MSNLRLLFLISLAFVIFVEMHSTTDLEIAMVEALKFSPMQYSIFFLLQTVVMQYNTLPHILSRSVKLDWKFLDCHHQVFQQMICRVWALAGPPQDSQRHVLKPFHHCEPSPQSEVACTLEQVFFRDLFSCIHPFTPL